MADIGALIIRIGADASNLEKAFHDLGGSAKQFQRGLDSISKTMQTAFFAGVTGAIAMAVQAGKTAEETEQLAQKTGIAAVSIEGMSVAMARHGLSAQSLSMAVKGLSAQMVGVKQGTASAVQLFDQMGLSLDVVQKGTGATLRAIADRFKELPDGAEKARFAVELFGKAGLDWIPILNKGGAALDAAMAKSVEFGLVLTETARNQLTVFDDAMDDMISALKGFGMQVGIAFAPSMTAIVKTFTDIIVYTKDVLNQLSDAGSVLAIRIGAMIASAQLLTKQLFSMTVLSKEAWQATLDQVKGIDQWAAAQIKAVAVARDAEKGLEALAIKQMDAAKAAEAHAVSQKRLGEEIVKSAQFQRNWAKESSHDVFSKLFEEEDVAAAQRYAGPMATMDKFENAQRGLLAMHSDLQKGIDLQAQAYNDLANAADAALVAETAAEVAAEKHNQEYQGMYMRTQHIAAANVKSAWQQQLETIVASNAFSVGQIVSGWTSGLANAIVNFENFGQTMTQIGKQTAATLLQGILQFGVQRAALWALQAGAETGIFSAQAAAVLGINTAKNAAIVAGDTAGATATVSIWAGAGEAMVGLFALISGEIESLIMGTIVPALFTTGTLVEEFLSAIAGALDISIFGAEFSVPVWAAVALVGAAIGSIAAFAFADGGIATGPTMGLVGEAGSPEAIIPLNNRGAAFMREAFGMERGAGQPIHTHVYLDRREIARAVTDDQPSALRALGALS